MTQELRFIFADVVNEALVQFPQLRETTLFATTSEREVLNRQALEHVPFPRSALAVIEESIEHSLKVKYSIANTAQGASMIVVYTEKKPTPDPEVDKHFSFDHELGHILIPKAMHPRVFPYVEAVADAYAAIRSIQRFGERGIDFITYKSWERASKFAAGDDDSHITTTVIDSIIRDSRKIDFSKLTPQQAAELAVKYADKWTPTADAIVQATDIFRGSKYRHGEEDKTALALLSSSALSTPGTFAAYIGGRVSLPFGNAPAKMSKIVPRLKPFNLQG